MNSDRKHERGKSENGGRPEGAMGGARVRKKSEKTTCTNMTKKIRYLWKENRKTKSNDRRCTLRGIDSAVEIRMSVKELN